MTNPTITTFTGKKVNPLDVDPDLIDIQDIAHALACCNRFAGHLSIPVNVAQHSVYVSRIVGKLGGNNVLELQGLLHDATEAYLGDITKHLKDSPTFKEYREAEVQLQYRIMEKFGCPILLDDKVWTADKISCDHEADMGGLDIGQQPPGSRYTYLIGHWDFWDWRKSEMVFMHKFNLLTGGLVLQTLHLR